MGVTGRPASLGRALAAAVLLALSVALPATAQPDDRRQQDKEFPIHRTNTNAYGIWSDGTTMWVVDRNDRKVYAYALDGGARQDGENGTTDREFGFATSNDDAAGIWSDDTTMWVVDRDGRKVYAYALDGGARRTDRELDLHSDNTEAWGIWSDQTTLWVLDYVDDKVYAYALDGGLRQDGNNGTTNREFDLHSDNEFTSDIWSDGTTMWVVDRRDKKAYAYALAGGARQDGSSGTTDREFGFTDDNGFPEGVWSNDATMWVMDFVDEMVYAYDVSDLTAGSDANAAPTFSSSSTFDAAENQTTADTVRATDGDSEDDITGYEITGGADQGFFSIGAMSGALTFDAAPNFEDAKDSDTGNDYVVEVQATSGTGERVKTATQTITVTVTDVTTEAPGRPDAPDVAAASVTSLTVNWSAPANAGPAIGDYDVRYRAGTTGDWSDGNHTGTATSATLTGLAENTAYQVQVRATNDEGTGSWSDSGTGTTDANAAPAFSSSSTFSIAENGTEVAMVMASDSDSEDKIERYDITGGADQALFLVIASSGHLEFRDAPNFEDAKDSDTGNDYVVEVQATSGTGERVKTATQTITVTVTDVTTEAPGRPDAPDVAAASVTSLTVNWSAPANAGPAIGDYDVRYRAGTTGDWSDGNHTGTATSATLTGLAENTAYQVQVRATNDEGTGSWSDPGTGTTDADANAAPTFSSSSTFDAAENQTSAGTVLATDGDTDDDITGYEITGGADQSFFSIGATSGALTFDAAPNFEDAHDRGTGNTYVVEVEATSGTGTREKTATQTITVTVTDVTTEAPGRPDAPDVAAASVTSLTVNWSAPANAGPAIGDYDVRYRAGTTGDWSDGNHTGTATSATLTGLAENTAYQVQVRATNDEGTGSWSDPGTGTTDADANAAPTFSSSSTFDAAENQTSAGTVLATDGDTDDDITGYEITGGADQSFFSIGATSGALTFDAAPNFEDAHDRGTGNTYVVEVEATSGTGTREKTATQTITVTVTDVTTEAPGRPDAPDVAAASVTSLTVNWSAPANAGPAIGDYDVRYRAGTTGDWSDGNHTGTATSATLTGLAESTSYQVQVRATNDEGVGSWSPSGTGTTSSEGICDRTPRVRDRILVLLKNRYSYKGDCSGVTREHHLAKLKSLDLGRNPSTENEFTMRLKEDDFEGLVNLERLYMRDTGLRSLPAGVFDGLAKLEELELNKNKLESLPAGVFSDLESLQMLKLRNNPSLESLPYDELEALPELTELSVDLVGRRKLQVAGGEDDAALEVPEGGSATYELRLMATTNAKAANPVKVTVSSSDESVVTASPATVSFTRENWFRSQTVTVSAEDTDSETEAKLSHTPGGGAYYAYDKLPLPGVTVTVLEAEEYRAPGEEDEEDPFTRPCSALAGRDGLTPAAAAAALWGDGDPGEGRLTALDSLGNGNGRYDLGDLLAWTARCRLGEASWPAAGSGPPFPPPALPSSRPEGGASHRRRRARGPSRRRTSPDPRAAAGSVTRRSGWLRTALLAAVTSAWGCGLGDGIAWPRDDAPRDGPAHAAVVDPGPLHVRLTAPAGARDIGAMLLVEGPAIDSLQAPGLELFERDASSPTRREVIIAGVLPPDGPVLRIWVPHRGDHARYRVRLLQVAREDFTLGDPADYEAAPALPNRP